MDLNYLLDLRGVETPCQQCRGLGTKHYASGSTWRGGMGTASLAIDVCDECWGSGDAEKHWLNLRERENLMRAEVAQRALTRLSGLTSVDKSVLLVIADEADKQARRRKLPVEGFWNQHSWVAVWHMFARLLREGSVE